jgi:hypothetical protein
MAGVERRATREDGVHESACRIEKAEATLP